MERLYDVWNLWADAIDRPEDGFQPGLRALEAIVREAEGLGKRVRPLGGAWSLSDAARTTEFMLNTKPLNALVIGFSSRLCDPSCREPPERLVFAQCGASVSELNDYLERANLALPTSGASDGQTICGAIATGTHGSAHGVGSMQDFILCLHIVAEGGKGFWIERASRPVASRALYEQVGAELVRDDQLFDAAIVSFGSFGIVHAVVFAAEPLYWLERDILRRDFDDVKHAMGTLDVASLGLRTEALPFHFEIILNPYATGRGQGGAWIRAIYKRPPPEAGFRPIVTEPGDDLLGMLGAVGDVVPDALPGVVGTLLEREMPSGSGGVGAPGQIFGPTTIRGPVRSTEIGVALADVPAAVDAIVEVARTTRFGGVIALRYVKPSPALLAFTRFAPMSCAIELPSAGTEQTRKAFEEIWSALDHRGIRYALHWGQCLWEDLNRSRIHACYGDRFDAWVAARRRFLTPNGRRMFASPFVERCGLAA
ncbi:FAD-dependent oxidoreductase [Minicystis rosea]|nr:FAD-dependent oxidoreductase [Minicystis rosea]